MPRAVAISDERIIKAVKAAELMWLPDTVPARELKMSLSRFQERKSRLKKAGRL